MRKPLEGFKQKNDMLWPRLKNVSLADGGGWIEEKEKCKQGDQLKRDCKWEMTVGDSEKQMCLWYIFEIELMEARFSILSGPWEWWSIAPATLILSRARSLIFAYSEQMFAYSGPKLESYGWKWLTFPFYRWNYRGKDEVKWLIKVTVSYWQI